MNRSIVISIVLALTLGYFLFGQRGKLESSEAHHLVQAGARLIDVRTAEEFESGHIPGAVNIPVQELERRLNEVKANGQPIVLYCRSGARSASAAQILKRSGYPEVHDLGAMNRW
jgi:phage shock protein E